MCQPAGLRAFIRLVGLSLVLAADPYTLDFIEQELVEGS